jgi:hypothetical protein
MMVGTVIKVRKQNIGLFQFIEVLRRCKPRALKMSWS